MWEKPKSGMVNKIEKTDNRKTNENLTWKSERELHAKTKNLSPNRERYGHKSI